MIDHKTIPQRCQVLNRSLNNFVLDDFLLRYTFRNAKVNIYVNRHKAKVCV